MEMSEREIKRIARREVNKAVRRGKLPRPADVPCMDCAHIGYDRIHHYDHYLGYDTEHIYHIQVVCAECHGERTKSRNDATPKTCAKGHLLTRDEWDGGHRCHQCRLEYWRARSKRLHAPKAE